MSKRSVLDRFLSFVSPEPNSGCWLWLGSVGTWGYGQFRLARKMLDAHRASWIINRGDIPSGLCVLHKCDNPSCVNPGHLYLGSFADNMIDVQTRLRGYRGDGARWTRQRQGRWDSLVRVSGRQKFLGSFATQREAHETAYEFVSHRREAR